MKYNFTVCSFHVTKIVIVYLNLVKFKFDIGLIYPGTTRVLILGSAFLYFFNIYNQRLQETSDIAKLHLLFGFQQSTILRVE